MSGSAAFTAVTKFPPAGARDVNNNSIFLTYYSHNAFFNSSKSSYRPRRLRIRGLNS